MGNKFGGKAVRTTYKAALFFVHLVMFIGFLFPMWIAMRVFAFDSFFIATASMEPTIHQGDIAIVNKALMGACLQDGHHYHSMVLVFYNIRSLI